MEGTPSLYDLLGVSKEATTSEITKAFRLMALKMHPDKNPNDLENAQINFQRLNKAYEILKNPEKRRIYDVTGETEDGEGFVEAYSYYRERYHKVTIEDIDSFASTYKNSEMEEEDLMDFYLDFGGNMTEILYYVPLSEPADLPRFFQIYDKLITDKTLPRKKVYTMTKNKVKSLAEDDVEDISQMESVPKKMITSDISDLVKQIQANRNKGESFLGYLESKYSKPKKRRKMH